MINWFILTGFRTKFFCLNTKTEFSNVMSITQTLYNTEKGQLEPKKIMVERTPIEESKKLSINRNALELIQDCSWEDLRGL